MIYKLNCDILSEFTGNKGKYLMMLKTAGFNVPDGFVLDSQVYERILNFSGIASNVENLLGSLNKNNISSVCKELSQLFTDVSIPEDIYNEISSNVDSTKKYAVRSSGLKEDLNNFSFAGQYDTFLNVTGINEITDAVISCYKSMFTPVILSYLIDNCIPTDDLKMAVVIQEMVNSELSGIAFTVNPATGNDKTVVIELAKGLGEEIVSGRVVPEQYEYNWYEDEYIYIGNNRLADRGLLDTMVNTFLQIQIFFGYPCDIEFAVAEGNLYILQTRAITKIKYSEITDMWSTADFKDGGVSAYVCTPYMWSLYEYIWEYTLRKFILDSKLLPKKDIPKKLGDMFFGRPYWNLTTVKKAMSGIPGYKEREFDSEYGIKITYEGDGDCTGFTVSALHRILKIALAQRKILKERTDTADNLKNNLLCEYSSCIDLLSCPMQDQEFERKWYDLTNKIYLKSESTYFWQIFINTIHQSLNKDSLLKYISENEYLGLISGIDNISHLLPFYDMWEVSRKIRKSEDSFKFWSDASVEEINASLGSNVHFLPQVHDFIEKYGYHSDRELDVTYPCYCEDTATVIKMFKDSVLLDDSFSPVEDKKRQKEEYLMQLGKIEKAVSANKLKKIKKKVDTIRNMLWWREEFRDISTRFYHLIRLYTLKLADQYVRRGILKCRDDIWMLKVTDLWNFIDGKIDRIKLGEIIFRNQQYYNSFRHFTSENEIGSVFDSSENSGDVNSADISGLGCSNGIVTGTARVVGGLYEIERIQQGDILITKFTDTGWTCKFAMLSGIVTEYGGILCHAAIVSREYGIPCIVCAHDAMKRIKDGSTVTINGATGEIKVIEK